MKLTTVALAEVLGEVDYKVSLQELAQEMIKYSNLSVLLREAEAKGVEVNFSDKAFLQLTNQMAELLNKITVTMAKSYKEQGINTTVAVDTDQYNYPIKVAYVSKEDTKQCYN